MFGIGEVTRLIEPRKVEVLFQDRLLVLFMLKAMNKL
jgi:hypothetical protein